MRHRLSGNAIAFIAMILWATQFPVTAAIIDRWDPVLLAPFRAGFSAVFLLFLLLVTGGAHNVTRAPWPHVWWIGGGLLSASTVLFIWGQKYTDPVTAAIIISMMPLISAGLGLLERTERLTVSIVAGIALAVIGGYLTNLRPGEGLLAFGFQGGEPYMLASVFLFVWYSRVTAKRLTGISNLAQACFTLMVAALGTAAVAIGCVMLGIVDPVYDISVKSMSYIAWCGAIAIGLAMTLWFAAIRRIGVTITTMHHNLVPFYVILMATMVGGTMHLNQTWGALLVFLGAALAQLPIESWLRKRRSRRGDYADVPAGN